MFDEYLAHYDECVEHFLMSEDEKDGLYHYQVPGAHWYTHDENRRQQSEKQYAKGKDTKGFIPPEDIIKKKIDRAKAKKKEQDKKKKDKNTAGSSPYDRMLEKVENGLEALDETKSKLEEGVDSLYDKLSNTFKKKESTNSLKDQAVNIFDKTKKTFADITKSVKNDGGYDDNGLKLLARNESRKDSMEKVNPKGHSLIYSLAHPNDLDYRMNCTNCTVAYELRRRGYDVEAQPNTNGRLLVHTPNVFPGATRRELFNWNSDSDPSTREQQAEQKILSLGDGARGELLMTFWYGGGHSVHFENKNGNVIVTDAQVNQTYEFQDIVDASATLGYYRFDDSSFNPKTIKQYVKNCGE